jgi:hypothetical protein
MVAWAGTAPIAIAVAAMDSPYFNPGPIIETPFVHKGRREGRGRPSVKVSAIGWEEVNRPG